MFKKLYSLHLFVLFLALFSSCTMMDSVGIGGDSALEVDQELVPAQFRHLTPIAVNWVLDDTDRPDKIDSLSKKEKRAIIVKVDPHLNAIDKWLDSFDPADMPDEAATFFWFREAVEEMRY